MHHHKLSFTAVDTTDPIITCPADVVVQSQTPAVATWTAPTVSDNVTPANQIIVVMSHSSGSTFPVDTTPVMYTAFDQANNQASCTFNVIITGV